MFLAFVQSVAIDTALGSETGIKADEYSWIGRFTSNLSAAIVWHTTGVKTLDDARKREILIGASGRRELNAVIAQLMNAYAGTKYKVVTGYAGGINEIFLAMERGEVEAFVPALSFLKNERPHWLKEDKVSIIYQVGVSRHPELLDVPTMSETARSEEGRMALDFIASSVDVGRSLVGTPKMPADRVTAVRAAFYAMVRDPSVIESVEKRNLAFETASGEEVERVVGEALRTPDHVLQAIKKAAVGL